MAIDAENVSIWWRHHEQLKFKVLVSNYVLLFYVDIITLLLFSAGLVHIRMENKPQLLLNHIYIS